MEPAAADTDYTIFAWKGGIGDTASKDNLIKSSPANVLTRLNDATKAVVTGGVVGAGITDAGIHVPMGRSVTFTVQLRDEKGRDVGPSPGRGQLLQHPDRHLYRAAAPGRSPRLAGMKATSVGKSDPRTPPTRPSTC